MKTAKRISNFFKINLKSSITNFSINKYRSVSTLLFQTHFYFNIYLIIPMQFRELSPID